MNPDITSDVEEYSKELNKNNENVDASLTFDNQIKKTSSNQKEIKHGKSSIKKNNKTAIAGAFSVVVIAVIAVISVVFYIKKLDCFCSLDQNSFNENIEDGSIEI